MIISTRGRYGIHAMFDIAQHDGEGPIALNTIARRQGIPEQYLVHLVRMLRHEGLLLSVRGAQGGYMLAAKPKDITVGGILRAVEGPLSPSDCLETEDGCEKLGSCPIRSVWEKIQESIYSAVDSISLEDILDENRRLGAESADGCTMFKAKSAGE